MASTWLVITEVRQLVTPDGTEFSADQEGAIKCAEANITIGTDSEIISDDSQGYTQVRKDSRVASADAWQNSSGDKGQKQILKNIAQ